MPREDLSQKYNYTVLEIIEDRLIPDQEAKKARGEVFTPLRLVNEMLLGVRKSALDRGKIEIWGLNENGELFDDEEDDRFGGIPLDILRNPDSKLLDPASGIGNYPVVAFYILDYQLNKHGTKSGFKGGKNKEKRQTHILKNMLYMIEINKGNVNVCNKIFKLIFPGSTINICCADTEKMSDEKLLEKFNVNRFNIVMGNPPFQSEGQSGGKNKLYERITVRGLQLLASDGRLIFVTPDNIMSGNTGSSYKQVIKLNTVVISFNNIQKVHFPGIGQPMCYFVVENSIKSPSFKTVIISQNKYFSVILKDRKTNPVKEWTKLTEGLITYYTCDEENQAVYFRGEDESKYTGGPYEVIYTPTKTLKTDKKLLAPGIGEYKIVLFEYKPTADGVPDVNGIYGVGPHTIRIPFQHKSHVKIMEKFFSSPEYKKLVYLTTTSFALKISFIKSINIDFILQQQEYRAATKIQNAHRKKTNKRRSDGGNRARKTKKYINKYM